MSCWMCIEKKKKLCEYKKGICKFYFYDCENSVFHLQSFNSSDFFSRLINLFFIKENMSVTLI